MSEEIKDKKYYVVSSEEVFLEMIAVLERLPYNQVNNLMERVRKDASKIEALQEDQPTNEVTKQ